MIYLDHNATTPMDERVVEAMLPYLRDFYGNPSGLYRLGRLSRGAIDRAREQVAALVGAKASEVIFTSGGTEANNMAIKGLASSLPPATLISGSTEHPAVTEPLQFLTHLGWNLVSLTVGPGGQPDPSAIEALQPSTGDIGTLMLANNETGVVHDTRHLADTLRAAGAYLHVDAVQAAGKIPVNFTATGAHSLTLSAHKMYGPKGVGALIVDRSAPIQPLLHGGGQEQNRRGGTENVAGIIGFGKAAELALQSLEENREHVLSLRQQLEAGLRELPRVTLFAEYAPRLPNTVQFGVPGFDGETLVMRLDRLGFAVSSGSACASGGNEPSPVLLAMGVDETTARSAIRVSLGRCNSSEQIVQLIEALKSLMTSH